MKDRLLEVRDLWVYIDKVQILRGINLDIFDGEIVCILGRNGAGKTTTMKAIIGLRKPSKGKIIYKNIDVTKYPPEKRALLGIGYQPEDLRLYYGLSVEENIMIPIWIRGSKHVNDTLERIFQIFPEVKSLLKRRSEQLSGGQRRMVAIARALASNPSLLLLDEPFEGLAPSVVDRLAKALKDIREQGISILYAESNLRRAAIADRIYVIERGEIIFQGSYDEILNNNEVIKVIGK